MVPFAGYSMPVQYPAGLMAEHKHTRAAAGLFDVSHMGQLRLAGPDAAAALESLLPVDVIDLPVGKQRYGLLLNENGGIIDDLMFFNKGNEVSVAGRPKTRRPPRRAATHVQRGSVGARPYLSSSTAPAKSATSRISRRKSASAATSFRCRKRPCWRCKARRR